MVNDADLDTILPLKPTDFHIMFALLDGQRYGYRIARDIEEATAGRIRIAAGNLHRTVQKLIRMGLLEATSQVPPEDPGNERRRYYALTRLGRRAIAADVARMKELVREAESRNIVAPAGGQQ